MVIGDRAIGYEFSNFRIFLYPMIPYHCMLYGLGVGFGHEENWGGSAVGFVIIMIENLGWKKGSWIFAVKIRATIPAKCT